MVWRSGDHLEAERGLKSKIRDRSATRTLAARGTTVADSQMHASFELQGPPTFATSPPHGHPVEGHVKVMLAYSHSLSHDHQGFRPFSPDHREAAGPVGPAAARVEVHLNHRTVPS